MSDIAQIVIAVCSAITAIGVPLIAYFMAKLNQKAASAAIKQDETSLQLTGIAETGEKTHRLANSAMLEQKFLVATSARGKANATGKVEDEALAKAAEEVYFSAKEEQNKFDLEAKTKPDGVVKIDANVVTVREKAQAPGRGG